jgi:hypothetical protein
VSPQGAWKTFTFVGAPLRRAVACKRGGKIRVMIDRGERRRSTDGSGVNREVHAPFCESRGWKLPGNGCGYVLVKPYHHRQGAVDLPVSLKFM